jgi:hypothetical protein
MKRNEVKTTVTHGEILCLALENLMAKQRDWENRAEKIKNDAHDMITAKEFLSHSPYYPLMQTSIMYIRTNFAGHWRPT